MPDLIVRIKKKSDGSAALSCIRADGTTTWQRQDGQLGRFFPLHDLTHFAVETVLGLRRAFYGLLAEGWDISDFGKPGARGRLTEDAGRAEAIVGFFDLERATGMVDSADDFNWKLQKLLADRNLPTESIEITDEQLARIREMRAQLFARWHAVQSGEALELAFDRAVEAKA